MHHGGEKTGACFRPVKRLLRLWRRTDRRGRVLAASACVGGLSASAASLYAVLTALSAAPPPMAFHDYTAAVAAGKVAEVLVRPQEAEVLLHGGERRQVRAPLDWQPMARLAEAGVALRYEPEARDRLPTISSLLGIATLLAFGLAWAFKMRDMTRAGRRFQTPAGTRGFADVAGQEEAKAELGDIVSYLRAPARFTAVGAAPCRGVLLFGPPDPAA
jgi:cell division protease FtsH